MSVPGAFAPTNVDGELLVDGGIMNNVPIDVARGMGATRLIVIDVGTPLATEAELSNPVALLNQMVGALTIDRVNRQLATLTPRDVLIQPALGKLGSADFNRAREAIDIGRAAAEAAVDRLRTFSATPTRGTRSPQRIARATFDPALDRVPRSRQVADRDRANTSRRRCSQKSASRSTPTKLEHDVGEVYGRGNYQQIDYHVVDRNGEKGLLIVPVDKPWGPVFGRFGFQLDDDFQGRSEYLVSAEITASSINRYGAEWRNTLWAGRIGGIYSEFYQPFGEGSTGYVMPYALVRNEDVPVFDLDAEQQLAEYRIKRRNIGARRRLDAGELLVAVGALERGRDNGKLARRRSDRRTRPGARNTRCCAPASRGTASTMRNFRRAAHASIVDYAIFRPVMGGEQTGNVARLIADWVPDFGALNESLSPLARHAPRERDRQREVHRIGELPRRLSQSLGLRRALVFRQPERVRPRRCLPAHRPARFAVLDAVLCRRKPRSRQHVARQERRAARFTHLRRQHFAGLKTPLGPVFLGYGYAEGGHNAVYLTFGSLLRNEP